MAIIGNYEVEKTGWNTYYYRPIKPQDKPQEPLPPSFSDVLKNLKDKLANLLVDRTLTHEHATDGTLGVRPVMDRTRFR